MRTYRNSTAGSGRHVSACFKARRVHGEGPVVALHLCTHTCINMMFDMYVYRSPRVHIPWRHACENMLAQCPHRIAPYTLFDTCSHAKADPLGCTVVNIFFFARVCLSDQRLKRIGENREESACGALLRALHAPGGADEERIARGCPASMCTAP